MCGDMTRGQSLIVWAIAEGRSSAAGVDRCAHGRHRPARPLRPASWPCAESAEPGSLARSPTASRDREPRTREADQPGRVAPTRSRQFPGSSRTCAPLWGASIISPAPT